MKRFQIFFLIAVGVFGAAVWSHAQGDWHTITHIGTVQTTDNLNQGEFSVEFNIYNDGGLNPRFIVGAFDFLSLGVCGNFDQLIGSEPVHVNLPGVYAKLNILPGSSAFNIAIGLDNFGFGESGSFIDTNGILTSIYGVFFNLSQSYYTFGSRDIFTFGFRVPLFPDEFRDLRNSSIFFGATLGTPLFYVGLTVENIYIDFTRFDSIVPTLTFNFSPTDQFEVSLGLQYNFDDKNLNRFLSLDYQSSF